MASSRRLRQGELWIRGCVDGEGALVVRIEDNGMGISREVLEELQRTIWRRRHRALQEAGRAEEHRARQRA